MPKAKNLTLTKSQAACLIALRHGKDFKTKIAIEAGLDLVKTAAALGALARLGLAEQGETKRWHMSARGKTCRFEIVPDRRRSNTGLLGSGGRRLLKSLDRPSGQEASWLAAIGANRANRSCSLALVCRPCEGALKACHVVGAYFSIQSTHFSTGSLPHGMIATDEVEFFGDPSIILSL
jgi:hypothetical protein